MAKELKEGDKAPAFTLLNDRGKKVALKDYLGKTVVLYFYPKDDTPGCTQEACDFKDNFKQLGKLKTVVLGVSKDSVEKHRKFKEKYSLPFDLLSDESTEMIQKYGVWKEKSLYGRKYMGIERSTFIIDGKGIITKIFPKVKVSGHVDEILELIK